MIIILQHESKFIGTVCLISYGERIVFVKMPWHREGVRATEQLK